MATALGQIADVTDPEVLRCVALAVAAARQGHAFLELEPADVELMRPCSSLVGGEEEAGRHCGSLGPGCTSIGTGAKNAALGQRSSA